MAREIKFRFWDTVHKEMKYDITCILIGYFAGTLSEFFNKLDAAIPMQYTGLLDKQGREIYEGDIVEWVADDMFKSGIIIFENGCFQIKGLRCSLGDFSRFQTDVCHFAGDDNWRVIGDVYSNPELLKEDSNGSKEK